jgi:protein tyrosine/serine phosphatase
MLRSIAFSLNLYLSLAAFAIAQFSNGATTAAPAKVPNFHQVADKLYRSGQPDIEGFRALADRYGIRTIISLRSVARNDLLLAGSDLRLRLRRFPLHAFVVAHEQDKIVAALRAIRAGVRNGPTLVHCEHGSDRTGLIVALYRILYQGWSKKQALHEMRAKAFGFHTIWGNIPRFIEDVDIGSLKQRVEGTNR